MLAQSMLDAVGCLMLLSLRHSNGHLWLSPKGTGLLMRKTPSCCTGQEPTVEVRQQDEDGRVHRLECPTDSWNESAREAQAQATRLRLMKSSSKSEAREQHQLEHMHACMSLTEII